MSTPVSDPRVPPTATGLENHVLSSPRTTRRRAPRPFLPRSMPTGKEDRTDQGPGRSVVPSPLKRGVRYVCPTSTRLDPRSGWSLDGRSREDLKLKSRLTPWPGSSTRSSTFGRPWHASHVCKILVVSPPEVKSPPGRVRPYTHVSRRSLGPCHRHGPRVDPHSSSGAVTVALALGWGRTDTSSSVPGPTPKDSRTLGS